LKEVLQANLLKSTFAFGRDLEKRIADLEELNGYEAPRTGGETRLNTKITGLFLHYPHKQIS
jgi:hypothetical protein